jgi:hypothetical protein
MTKLSEDVHSHIAAELESHMCVQLGVYEAYDDGDIREIVGMLYSAYETAPEVFTPDTHTMEPDTTRNKVPTPTPTPATTYNDGFAR